MGWNYTIPTYGPVLLLCVLRKRKTKVMSARLVIIIPSNLLSQYSIFKDNTKKYIEIEYIVRMILSNKTLYIHQT